MRMITCLFIRNIKKWLNIIEKYSNYKYCTILKVFLAIFCKDIKSYDFKRTPKKSVFKKF